MSLTQQIKQFVPPVALPIARRLGSLVHRTPDGKLHVDLRPVWEVVPSGWQARKASSAGWSDPSVIAAQRAKWPSFISAVSGAGPLGIAHEAAEITNNDASAQNEILAFAYVLARAAIGKSSLSVLDWGGGVGHYAVIANSVLPEVPLNYFVKDVPALCELGQELLPGSLL